MAIIERAFSYGGILIRTFHHADSPLPPPPPPPPPPATSSSAANSPVWLAEHPGATVKRPRGRKKRHSTNINNGPIHLSALLTPEATTTTTTPDSGSGEVGPDLRVQGGQVPPYLALLTPAELRVVQTRNRRGRQWIPSETTVRRELKRLGRDVDTGVVGVSNPEEGRRAEDMGRFPTAAWTGVQEREVGVGMESYETFADGDHGHGMVDGGFEWMGQGDNAGNGDGRRGSEYGYGGGHPAHVPHAVTLPSPIPMSTRDDRQGLYLPPLPSTHGTGPNEQTPTTTTTTSSYRQSLIVKLSLPSTAQRSRVPPPPQSEPTVYTPPRTHHFQAQLTLPRYSVDSNHSSQSGRGRGRPRKSLQAPDIHSSQPTPAPPQPSPALRLPPNPIQQPAPTPPAPQPHIPPLPPTSHPHPFTAPTLTYTPSHSPQKRKRAPSSPALTDTDTTKQQQQQSLHLPTVTDLLSHLTHAISSSTSGFIPRPVKESYTLPVSTLSTYGHASGPTQLKSFGVALVGQISTLDSLHWRIAHSQWSTAAGKNTPGARWVCNLSEEGARDRSKANGNGNDATPQQRTRYPCGGGISLRLSAGRGLVSLRYMHHSVHAPPPEDEAPQKRARLFQGPPMVAPAPAPAPAPVAPGFGGAYPFAAGPSAVDGGGGGGGGGGYVWGGGDPGGYGF